MDDIIFQPLRFRNLTVKNRIFRSNISGRFDNFDGSGSNTRLNWEEKFARGGVGAILSSFVAVSIHGRIMPNYATIDSDDKIPFWREVGQRVHAHDCRSATPAGSRTFPASKTSFANPSARPTASSSSTALSRR